VKGGAEIPEKAGDGGLQTGNGETRRRTGWGGGFSPSRVPKTRDRGGGNTGNGKVGREKRAKPERGVLNAATHEILQKGEKKKRLKKGGGKTIERVQGRIKRRRNTGAGRKTLGRRKTGKGGEKPLQRDGKSQRRNNKRRSRGGGGVKLVQDNLWVREKRTQV